MRWIDRLLRWWTQRQTVATIKKLSPKPGDVIVIHYADGISATAINSLRRELNRKLPLGVPALLLPSRWTIRIDPAEDAMRDIESFSANGRGVHSN